MAVLGSTQGNRQERLHAGVWAYVCQHGDGCSPVSLHVRQQSAIVVLGHIPTAGRGW